MNRYLLSNKNPPLFISFWKEFWKIFHFNGGETGIRTPERLAPLTVFKTAAFDRSAISPFIGGPGRS